jgi:transposase
VDTSKKDYSVSTMEEKAHKRPQRKFTTEFKEGAVRLVLDEGKPMSQVARDLDLTKSALGRWVKQARIDRRRGPAGALTSDERAELNRLRKQVRDLEIERSLLKKWVAYCAKENG